MHRDYDTVVAAAAAATAAAAAAAAQEVNDAKPSENAVPPAERRQLGRAARSFHSSASGRRESIGRDPPLYCVYLYHSYHQ